MSAVSEELTEVNDDNNTNSKLKEDSSSPKENNVIQNHKNAQKTQNNATSPPSNSTNEENVSSSNSDDNENINESSATNTKEPKDDDIIIMNGNGSHPKTNDSTNNTIKNGAIKSTETELTNNTKSQPQTETTTTTNTTTTTTTNTMMTENEPTNIRKICKIGYDEDGDLMPGFEDVNDDQMAFSSESDFAIFIKQISSEIPLQRLVAVKRMIKSCHLWGEEAVLSVLPRVKQLSCDKEMVIRQAIAEVLGPFAKYLVESMQHNEYEINTNTNTNNSTNNETTETPKGPNHVSGLVRAHNVIISELLPLIKEMLKDAMEVRQGAGSSLIIIAELLNKEEVYEHILKIVLHMAHDDSDDQKITALPLLGDLAPIVGSAVCKNYLSADLHALSQDNSFRVRKATVQYFGPICEQLGSVDAEECLLPIFLSLCSDSIWSVRKGCVESFVDVSSSISSDSRVSLIPIMEKFLNDSSRWVRNTAYEILGPFISSLASSQISTDFLKYFTSIPHLSSAEADADCTNHCAFNFPAVCLTVGRERWLELNETYNILCRKTFKSRKTLACSIHEIASILGQELTEKYLLSSIEFFLKDIDDIRQGIIQNLWKILTIFNEKLRCEYISILWELASESDVNWRFRLLLSKQLDEILYLYSPQIIKQQIIPLIFQLCQDRMADVRYAAVYPIADAINILSKSTNTDTDNADNTDNANNASLDDNDNDDDDNKKDVDNLECITKKIQTIYKGRTYSKRLLYIRICDSCFNRIDNEIFDKIFLNDLLNYAHDKIKNVRYCLSRFMFDKFTNTQYLKKESVISAIEILKNDIEDIEIKRFFMPEDEIEIWLKIQKQQKREKLLLEQQQKQQQQQEQTYDGSSQTAMTNKHKSQKSKDSDLDSTDSSLYSSSDSDDDMNGEDDDNFDDDDDDNLNDDDLDLSADDDDDEDLDDDELNDDDDDKLNSIEQQLKNIGNNLVDEEEQNKLNKMDINTIGTNEISPNDIEQMSNNNGIPQGLVHQDTPYKLNIPPPDDDDQQKEKKDTNTGNYGLPLKNDQNENENENENENQIENENDLNENAEDDKQPQQQNTNENDEENVNNDDNDNNNVNENNNNDNANDDDDDTNEINTNETEEK